MPRWVVILAVIAACKGEPPEGVSGMTASTPYIERVGALVKVGFTVRLEKPLEDSRGLAVRAACQVGSERLVEIAERTGPLQPGVVVEPELQLFGKNPLPATPSFCDYEVSERGMTTSRVLARFCRGERSVEATCPPNYLSSVGVGPTGVSAVVSGVERAQFYLEVRYRATAHRDMPAGAHLVRMTSCTGHTNDDSWHPELGELRAGESIVFSTLTKKLGMPFPATSCETVLGYATELHGEITDLATFCHGYPVTPGRCRRR